MSVTKSGYIGKLILFFVFLFFNNKRMLLPDTFVVWVWVLYIANIFLSYYTLGLMHTEKDITRIFLSRKSRESNKLVRKMYSALLPHSMFFTCVIWRALEIFSFVWILRYQGLILGVCSEILLFIIIAILPIQYNSNLRNIYKPLGESGSKKSKELTEAGFDFEEVKSIVEKAINEKIDPHVWWLEIKRGSLDKDEKS
ncbi:MAG: hypothetical protein K9N06_09080 [Candidatus Cloacimonetes bacterium]|nr:hypothetical protein [Candidatus Cloacimonadota bacterium]